MGRAALAVDAGGLHLGLPLSRATAQLWRLLHLRHTRVRAEADLRGGEGMGNEVKGLKAQGARPKDQGPRTKAEGARWLIILLVIIVLGFGIWVLGFAFPKEDE